MRRDDLIWLVGILEGEGCFHMARSRGRKPSPRISLRMVDEDIVARVAKLIGRSYGWSHCPSARAAGQQPVYYTAISGKPALDLMRVLRPRLGQRRQARIRQLLKEAA